MASMKHSSRSNGRISPTVPPPRSSAGHPSRNGAIHQEEAPAWDQARIPTNAGGRPSHEEIAAAAYQIYLAEGSQPGQDMQHWHQAEAQLTATAPMTMEADITVTYESGSLEKKSGRMTTRAVV